LVLRRRFPLGVFAASAIAVVVLSASGYPPGPPLGPTLALFFLGLHPAETRGGRRLTAAVVVLFYLLHFGAVTIGNDDGPGAAPLLGILLWGGAWVIGDRFRLRRERMAALAERARRAEQDAEREGRLAVAEERMRIARDLHDSAGHAINVIAVRAGAARLGHREDPDRSLQALEAIEEVARDTVDEIDKIVAALRDDTTPAEPTEAPPGLASVNSLVSHHTSAGLAVRVRTCGTQRLLTSSVDQAAYRILQEALTNASRHGTGTVSIDLAFGADALDVTVVNPVFDNGAAAPGSGHGLVGMRERAALVGGSLDAGRANGAFRVRACLPYDACTR
ncbi:MAG TPA: histidine kinase, partial [Acidimicrobiales bacterium]|nr:histidine kinase [Acidimicrobiales bacterium]